MTTEHDLDARLQVARGLREEDLPALPAAFLDYLHASDAQQPEIDAAPVRGLSPVAAETPASVLAAQQLVQDAHQRHGGAVVHSRRRPSRKTVLRIGATVIAVAAAWTTAVVITAPAGERPPTASPEPTPSQTQPPTVGPVDPPGGLTLVAAEAITFPYSLAPAPKGLTPLLAKSGGISPSGPEPVVWSATYQSDEDPGFTIWMSPEDPRKMAGFEHPQDSYGNYDITETGTVSVGGAEAELVRGDYDQPLCGYAPATPVQTKQPEEVCAHSFADLIWERRDGQWVWIRGEDSFAEPAAVVGVAESLVDGPQTVMLQVGLSPAGWSVSGYEDNHALTLISDADPSMSNRISVSLQERWRGITSPADVLRGMTEDNPVEKVTVKGRPAELVSVPDHFAENRRMWNLAAQLPDGVVFLLQAPDTLSREDVLAIAEQVTYTP